MEKENYRANSALNICTKRPLLARRDYHLVSNCLQPKNTGYRYGNNFYPLAGTNDDGSNGFSLCAESCYHTRASFSFIAGVNYPSGNGLSLCAGSYYHTRASFSQLAGTNHHSGNSFLLLAAVNYYYSNDFMPFKAADCASHEPYPTVKTINLL
jgi:hypothetical protein